MSRFDVIDQETLNQLHEVAADVGTKSFQFLKTFASHPASPLDWKVSNLVVTNEEALALADEAAMGWERFANNKPAGEGHWVPVIGNKRPPRPNSFTDQSKWDRWGDGRPKDPWAFRTRLPLKITTGDLTGKVVLYNGENEASRYAISNVLAAFAENRRRPLILLTSVKRDGENIFDPDFQIIRFTDDDTVIPGLNLAKHKATAAEPKPPTDEPQPPVRANGGHGPLDDEIPFSPCVA